MAEMMKKPITLDVNHMMADTLGFQYGIARSQVEESRALCGGGQSGGTGRSG